MLGETIADYKILEKIGEGGFGVVYKGIHKLTEQEVAIKTIDMVLTYDQKFKERFFSEAKIQAKLNHPNIVVMHNFFQFQGRYFIVMEYLEGFTLPDGKGIKTLHQFINLGPVPEEKIFHLFKQVLEGVGYAHKRGILHRDIKPLNILFTTEGLIKIADFGIAKIVAGDTNVSVSGTRVGTPLYMSPEQVLNEPLDKTSDIYSLGITLYEMAVGEVPFKATSTTSVEKQHLFSPPPPPREKNPDISLELEKVILKALEKKREDRFQSCEEFLKALEKIKEEPVLIGIPLLIGKEIEEAKRILSSSGLKLIIEEDYSEDILFGFIMRQTPLAGSVVERGKEVKVILSKGKKPFIDVTVKEEEVKKVRREEVEKGREEEVEKGSGAIYRTKKGSPLVWVFIPIMLLLVIGGYLLLRPKPPQEMPKAETFTMPDLRGLTLNNARELISERGLVLAKTDSIYSDEVKKGEVVSFSPPAGTELRKGQAVNIVYSCGLKTCPQCHTLREFGSQFCAECGYRFE